MVAELMDRASDTNETRVSGQPPVLGRTARLPYRHHPGHFAQLPVHGGSTVEPGQRGTDAVLYDIIPYVVQYDHGEDICQQSPRTTR